TPRLNPSRLEARRRRDPGRLGLQRRSAETVSERMEVSKALHPHRPATKIGRGWRQLCLMCRFCHPERSERTYAPDARPNSVISSEARIIREVMIRAVERPSV